MTGWLIGKCQRCGAAVSYFARACPNCHAPNWPNPVAAIAALAAAVLAGGAIVLALPSFRSNEAEESPPTANAPSAAAPSTEAAADYGWIVRAMAECDEEAKHRSDRVNFLIVPVAATGVSLPGWSPTPIGTVGNAVALLHSTDTLIGLRNRVLVLYEKPMTFAVSDPATNSVYKWKPAVGVTAFTTQQIDWARLTLGFQIPDVAGEIEWGPTIELNKGTCYWVNPLVRGGAAARRSD